MHFDISKMFLYIFVVLVQLLHMVQYYLFDQAEAIVKVSVNSQCQQSMSTNVSRSLLMVKGYIFILWFKPPSKVWYFKSILISYKKTRNKFQNRVRS